MHEDGEWLAELATPRGELRFQGKSPLVHLWSEDRSLVRRVVRVAEASPQHLVLEVQRFGRTKPGKLELRRTDAPRAAGRVAREKFRARFRRLLEQSFPDSSVRDLTTAADLERSFSGLYTRGMQVEGAREWAVIGVSEGEDTATVEGILTFGLLWLDWMREHAERRAVAGLRVFIPVAAGPVLRHRIQALDASAGVELYEFSEREARVRRVGESDRGNVRSWLVPRRESEATLAAASEAIHRIRGLVPEAADAIEARVVPERREVSLRFRGHEFARCAQGKILFGLGDDRRELREESQSGLEKILRELTQHRSGGSKETNHPLYRAAPEKWLETMILADPVRLDAQLEAHFLYSQVPALAAGERSVMDLLGVTRAGRLVVIELKASEDLHLPLQAVDYWLRVRWHQREGDFQRYGYFSGIELDSRPPLLWLVSPGLRFHPSTDVILKYLSQEIEITRIGLNETWRKGIQVIFRQ